MTIKVGDTIPNVNLYHIGESGGPEAISSHDVFAGKKTVLFAVPGAFTRTKAKGVDEVACISVNDAAVMNAWGMAHGAPGKVMMLSDGIADFAKAIGIYTDMSQRGYGIRSKRYAMVIDNNKVTALDVEPSGEYGVSSAEQVLERL